jgi:peptidoglycan hydrolase-like protein with peptidoglycan-binding domain
MFGTLIATLTLALSPAPPGSAETTTVDGQGAATLAAATSPAPDEAKTITLGDCGPPVARLERKLEELRYLLGRFAGNCFDGALSQAVMALQKHEGIDRDGVFGPQTAAALAKARPPEPPAGGAATRIDVDLSDQLAYVVVDKEPVTVLSIASGQSGYDTPKGTFAVERKEEQSWSRPYKVWMPWASYFNGGIALHENSSVWGYAASHGCVRVPPPYAEWLYGVADLGVQVRVLG